MPSLIALELRYTYAIDDNITVIFNAADETIFRKILSDGNHLLAPLLPSEVCTPYHLRPRAIIGNLFLKSTNCVIAISSSACCIRTRTDCLLYHLYYCYVLSCFLSSRNKRILYCIVCKTTYTYRLINSKETLHEFWTL